MVASPFKQSRFGFLGNSRRLYGNEPRAEEDLQRHRSVRADSGWLNRERDARGLKQETAGDRERFADGKHQQFGMRLVQ